MRSSVLPRQPVTSRAHNDRIASACLATNLLECLEATEKCFTNSSALKALHKLAGRPSCAIPVALLVPRPSKSSGRSVSVQPAMICACCLAERSLGCGVATWESPIPVTARLSEAFYDRLGDAITNELVDWLAM